MNGQDKSYLYGDTETEAPIPESQKKTGFVQGARDFLENTLSSLKGKDLNQAVEEFTSEMTLVLEGLSEDQNVLRTDDEKIRKRLENLKSDLNNRNDRLQSDISEILNKLDAQDEKLDDLARRVEQLENQSRKKPAKSSLSDILKQCTWIIGVFCAAWVLVTLLKLIGG